LTPPTSTRQRDRSGEILERNGLRDKVNIATKLPHYLIKSREMLEKTFAE
jgi:predicted aldo/keto reductase-like oxidoreductase